MLPRIARLRRSIRGYGQSWDGEIYNPKNGKSYCGLVILVNPDLLRSRAACYSFAPGRIDSLALKGGSRSPDEARRQWKMAAEVAVRELAQRPHRQQVAHVPEATLKW